MSWILSRESQSFGSSLLRSWTRCETMTSTSKSDWSALALWIEYQIKVSVSGFMLMKSSGSSARRGAICSAVSWRTTPYEITAAGECGQKMYTGCERWERTDRLERSVFHVRLEELPADLAIVAVAANQRRSVNACTIREMHAHAMLADKLVPPEVLFVVDVKPAQEELTKLRAVRAEARLGGRNAVDDGAVARVENEEVSFVITQERVDSSLLSSCGERL